MNLSSLNLARLLMVCSGVAALGWQMSWTTQWSLLLGHEIYAVLSITAAFFCGLGLGTWFTTLRFFQFAKGITVYVMSEMVIAMWGLFLLFVLPSLDFVSPLILGLTPSPLTQSLFAFAFPLFVLLPATTAMGVTLPSLLKNLKLKSGDLADLYSFNTLGATLGVTWIVFFSLPQLGMARSEFILAGINVFCALLASYALKPNKMNSSVTRTALSNVVTTDIGQIKNVQQFLPMFFLGFLGICYQVIAVRVLSLVTENTVFSYALILTVYLSFHAAGAALFKIVHQYKDRFLISDSLTLTFFIACLLIGFIGLAGAEHIYLLPSKIIKGSMLSALSGEAFAAFAALALPSAAMGYLFAHQSIRFENHTAHVGLSLSSNILGAALAPLIMGLFVFPVWGTAVSLSLVLMGYILMQSFTKLKDLLKFWPICFIFFILNGNFSWDYLTVPQGGKLLFYEDGLMASVSVTQDVQGVAHLQINNRVQEGSSASSWVERRLAILPLMFHPKPEQILILGLGTGFTAASAAEYGKVKVQAVELLPEVVKASQIFKEYPNFPQPRSEVKVTTADARRFVNSSPDSFDVIVSDLFHPARSGAATLYTVEHFQKVKDKLNDGGVFCQWLALHQMDVQTLQSIVASYLLVFPDAKAVLASNSLDSPVIGLISRKNANLPLVVDMQKNWLDPEKALSAGKARLDDPYAVWGSVLADSDSLSHFSRHAAPNTDDFLKVSYGGPRVTYAPQEEPRDRLNQIISDLEIFPNQEESLLVQNKLQAYWRARKSYLQIGLSIKNGSNPQLILSKYEDRLFQLIKESPEFRPAYDTMISLATAIKTSNPDLSNMVMNKLKNYQ